MDGQLEAHVRRLREKNDENIRRFQAKLVEAEVKKKLLDNLLEAAQSLASSSPTNGGLIGRALQMIADSDEGLTYKEIEGRLKEEGLAVNEKSLQTQLLTRRKRGFIERDDEGRYIWTGRASEDEDDADLAQRTNGLDATASA